MSCGWRTSRSARNPESAITLPTCATALFALAPGTCVLCETSASSALKLLAHKDSALAAIHRGAGRRVGLIDAVVAEIGAILVGPGEHDAPGVLPVDAKERLAIALCR